jgi:hypothetical protein
MNEKSTQLIRLYFFICDDKDSALWSVCQRFSPNNCPSFSDEELITAYLFALQQGFYSSLKRAYEFIRDYWKDWFPQLPSYPSFITRLNRLVDFWPAFVSHLIGLEGSLGGLSQQLVMDSCPIIVCQGYRKPRSLWLVKGFCAAKKLYYYGVKLHCVACVRPGKLPFPLLTGFTNANQHDLTAIKYELIDQEGLEGCTLIADKAYISKDLKSHLKQKGCSILTPRKNFKGTSATLKQSNNAQFSQWNSFIAKIRHDIEKLFASLKQNWDIQNASKIRSKNGLNVHIFAKLSAFILKNSSELNS